MFCGVSSLLPTDPHYSSRHIGDLSCLYNIPEYNMLLENFILIFKVFPHVLCNKTLDIRRKYHKIIIASKIQSSQRVLSRQFNFRYQKKVTDVLLYSILSDLNSCFDENLTKIIFFHLIKMHSRTVKTILRLLLFD